VIGPSGAPTGMATAIGNLECGGACPVTGEPAHRAGRYLIRDSEHGREINSHRVRFRRRIEVRCVDCKHEAVFELSASRDPYKRDGSPAEVRGRILSKPMVDSSGEQRRDEAGHLIWIYDVVEAQPGDAR